MTKEQEIRSFIDEKADLLLKQKNLPFKLRIGIKTIQKKAARLSAEEMLAVFVRWKSKLAEVKMPKEWKVQAEKLMQEFSQRFEEQS